jgi:hypothetical protein
VVSCTNLQRKNSRSQPQNRIYCWFGYQKGPLIQTRSSSKRNCRRKTWFQPVLPSPKESYGMLIHMPVTRRQIFLSKRRPNGPFWVPSKISLYGHPRTEPKYSRVMNRCKICLHQMAFDRKEVQRAKEWMCDTLWSPYNMVVVMSQYRDAITMSRPIQFFVWIKYFVSGLLAYESASRSLL